MTAEDRFSDDEVHTSEYHSPPEEPSDSEEEEEEEEKEEEVREKERRRGDSGRLSTQGRVRPKKGSPKETKLHSQPLDNTATTTTTSSVEERQRLASERHRSFSGGVLSPVQESPEYARTPSTHGSAACSADELEKDLNKALSQLDSETSGLQADAKEVEYIEQRAARISESSHSGSPSPFPDSTPTTPNTVVWKKGTCVELSSTPDPKTTAEDEQEREKEREKEGEGDRKGEGEGEGVGSGGKEVDETDKGKAADEGEEFSAIPKVAPSLGLKEGHDRQQLAVARSSNRRRPPTRHTATQVRVCAL